MVYTFKAEEGLGLRRLADWNQVLALKLIWLLFAAGGSLWVSWMRLNKMGSANFWMLEPRRGDSWIWKKLCKLRSKTRHFIICELGLRITSSFWYDNWTDLGPLIHLTGEQGPEVSSLHKDVRVVDAIVNGEWWLNAFRSMNFIITLLKQCLPSPDPIVQSPNDDTYLWKVENDPPSDYFSTAKTWTALHPARPSIFWHSQIWFKGRVPKYAFISWLVAWNKLATKNIMRGWGIDVSPSCLLFSGADECRQHLFFYYVFSAKSSNQHFCSRLNLAPPGLFEDCLRWLKSPTTDADSLLIIKLIFQAVIYSIWKERNSRLHTNICRKAQIIVQDVKKTLRLRLDPLSWNMRPSSSSTSTSLGIWLSIFEGIVKSLSCSFSDSRLVLIACNKDLVSISQ